MTLGLGRATAVAVLLCSQACGTSGNSSPQPEPGARKMQTDQMQITRLLLLQSSALIEPATHVVRERSEFDQLWARLHATTPLPATPEVDFSRSMVLVIAVGERPTGGHTVRVDSVRSDGAGIVVRYTTTSPGDGCISTQAITSPVEVVSVRRVDGAVRFERVHESKRC